MRTYENKDELKNEINKSFAKYISEFNDIPEHLKDKRIDEIDRTPAENLAYQVGWTTLVIKWESDERKGIPVKTPSDNFKWNQLGELYQWFTDTYAQLSLQELKDRLNENINSIYVMIDSEKLAIESGSADENIEIMKAYMCEQRGIRLIKLPMKGTELDYADSLKRAFQNVHIFISSDTEEDVEIIKNTFERWRDSQ